MKFCIINGPNLNLLGKREKDYYGNSSLAEIIERTEKKIAEQCGDVSLSWHQFNAEHDIVNKIHEIIENDQFQALIINPASLSHTSISIYDALLCLSIPICEVHLSNTIKRESFRHNLLTAGAADFIMKGLGEDVYFTAAWFLYSKLGV